MPRPTFDWRSAGKDNYNRFKSKHPDLQVSFEQFINILHTSGEVLVDYLVETGDAVRLPYGFGLLTVSKKKISRFYIDKEGNKFNTLPVNWKESKKLGKRVYHLNHHTEGYRFKFLWSPRWCKLKVADIWSLNVVRKHSRHLAKKLLTEKKYQFLYQEWDN